MDYPLQSDAQTLVVSMTVKEDKVAEFIKLVNENQVATRKEPGVLRAEFMRDKEIKNKFYVNDVYRNQAAWDHHAATPEFALLGAFMESGALEGPP